MKTATMLMTKRPQAIACENSRNVRTRAAGFSAGAASIIAREGARRDDRRMTDEKTGVMQQEQSISGAPEAPAISCARARRTSNRRDNAAAGMNARTAALMSRPNTRAGQITAR